MISMMMPAESWVAKWNNLSGKMPGVYALHVKDNDVEEKFERNFDQAGDDDADLEGFVVGDGQNESSYEAY